jgi:MFS family permease
MVITLLVAGAFFMENLDGTVIATALPQMARSFGRSPVDLNVGLTAYLSWRWIFFLNVPLGVIGVCLAAVLIPNARPDEKKAFDWIGFILIGLACAGLMHGLEMLGQQGSGVWWTAGLPLVGSLVCGAVAVWHARRYPHPLLNSRALRVPTPFGSRSREAPCRVWRLVPFPSSCH